MEKKKEFDNGYSSLSTRCSRGYISLSSLKHAYIAFKQLDPYISKQKDLSHSSNYLLRSLHMALYALHILISHLADMLK